jgi:hypothetical protein
MQRTQERGRCSYRTTAGNDTRWPVTRSNQVGSGHRAGRCHPADSEPGCSAPGPPAGRPDCSRLAPCAGRPGCSRPAPFAGRPDCSTPGPARPRAGGDVIRCRWRRHRDLADRKHRSSEKETGRCHSCPHARGRDRPAAPRHAARPPVAASGQGRPAGAARRRSTGSRTAPSTGHRPGWPGTAGGARIPRRPRFSGGTGNRVPGPAQATPRAWDGPGGDRRVGHSAGVRRRL